jgi:hypothetical protein
MGAVPDAVGVGAGTRQVTSSWSGAHVRLGLTMGRYWNGDVVVGIGEGRRLYGSGEGLEI